MSPSIALGLVVAVAAACHHAEPAPEPPSCAAAADHVRGLLGPDTPKASRIRDVFAARCEADDWDRDARACVVATTSLRKPRHCKARLSPEQRAALDRALAGIDAPPPPAISAGGRLPRACRDYAAMVQQLDTCPGVGAGTRGELELAFRNLELAWQRGRFTADTVELQCRAMVNGLRRAVGSLCGW
jgi:hypothetical protein